MSVDIYPAHIMGNEVIHADDWDDDSTINIANGNFSKLAKHLQIIETIGSYTGTIKVKSLRLALQTTSKTEYHDRLNALCAKAEVLRAPYIAFA